MKKRIALLAAITLLAGICTVPVSASVTVTPQSDVLVRYDFEDATDSLFTATTASMLAEITPEKGNETNKVQRFYKDSNKGEGGSAKNDTMFNLPYIPEIIEISYDFNIINYGSLAKDDQIWYSTYLKVGTGNGDEENFYSRHRFPKLFAADNSQNRGLSFRVDPKGNANITSTGRLGVSHGNWYTLITRINNTAKTSEVFAMKRGDSSSLIKLGESSGIEIKDKTFGLEMRADTQNSLKSDVYIDNIEVRDISTEKKNTFGISTLSVADGLTGVARLTDDVARAELLCDGKKICDIDAATDKVFNISAGFEDAVNFLGTAKFELVCYNAANTEIDRVTSYKGVDYDIYIVKHNGQNHTQQVTTADTATAELKTQAPIISVQRVENKTTKLSFDVVLTEEINQMGLILKGHGVNDSYTGIPYLPDQSLIADKKVYTDSIFDTADLTLNEKYHVDVIYNPFTHIIYYNLLLSDGTVKAQEQRPFVRVGTTVPFYGIKTLSFNFYAKQGGSGTMAITDASFSHLERMIVPKASSYVLNSGETVSLAGGKVPASAKSVSVTIDNFSGIDAASVKVLKNGAEVSGASVSIAASSLKVEASFEHGRYDIVIPTGAQYLGETLTMPVHAGFDIENIFSILSPSNGEVIGADGTKISVADDGEMTGVELYVNGTPCTMTKNSGGIWEYSFVPTEPGSVTAEAVASYEGGTTKKISVAFSVKNTAELFNPGVKIAADTGFVAKGNGKYGATGNTDNKLKYTLLEERNNTKWNGILKFGYDISFSDVSKFALVFEAQHSSNNWGAYPLNEKGSTPLVENGWAKDAYGNNAYQYTANKTYRFEYEYDLTKKVQNAYVTDLSTGEKTTLGKNIRIQKYNDSWTDESKAILQDNAYLWQMQLYVIQAADATENDTFTISNGYFKKVMDVPEISAVAYEKDGAFISSLNDTVKASAKLKYTLSSSAFDAGSMTKSNIKLLKNGTEVTLSEASYTAPELTVVPEGGIDANAEYKLVITKAATVSGASIGLPVVKTVKTANESGLYFGNIEMTKTDSKVNAKVAYSSSESAAVPAVLIIAVYNGNRMTDINVSDSKSVSGTGYLETEVSYKSADVLSAKAFVWKALDSAEPYGIEKSISLAQPTE